MVKLLLILSLGFLVTEELPSYNSLLQKLNVKMKKETISYKSVITLYKTHTSQEIIDTKQTYYLKVGNKSFYQVEQAIVINTPKMYIQIDTVNKLMFLKASQKNSNPMEVDFEMIEKYVQGRPLVKELKQSYKLGLQVKENVNLPIEKLNIFLTKKGSLLRRMELYYRQGYDFGKSKGVKDISKARMIINYSGWNFNPKYDSSIFNSNKYCVKRGTQYVPSMAYKNYKIISHIN